MLLFFDRVDGHLGGVLVLHFARHGVRSVSAGGIKRRSVISAAMNLHGRRASGIENTGEHIAQRFGNSVICLKRLQIRKPSELSEILGGLMKA